MRASVLFSVVAVGLLGWFVLARAGGRKDDPLDVIGASVAALFGGNMKTSNTGIQKVADREGFSATRYKDADGYSIAFGHFIKLGETFSEPISQADGFRLLRSDIEIAENAVNGYVTVPLTQSQFDALVSFVYNVGASAFRKSTMLKKLNEGDYTAAAAQFAAWKYSQGEILPVLIARREDEAQQFRSA